MSRPQRLARLTPPEAEERVVEARRSLLLAPPGLSAATGVPARTSARIVARRGMPRLADVDRVTGEVRRRGPATSVRYERGRPGELVHVDVKKVPRIPDGGGWRARGRGCGSARATDFFASLGVTVESVMTDNGPGYRSGAFNGLLASRGVSHKYTRPYSPWQNGKVERMNRTLAQEWQYGSAWESEADRADALSAYIVHCNWSRPHSACGGNLPMSRIVGVNNVMAHNT